MVGKRDKNRMRRGSKSPTSRTQMLLMMTALDMGVTATTAKDGNIDKSVMIKLRKNLRDMKPYADKPLDRLAYLFQLPTAIDIVQQPRFVCAKYFWALFVVVIWSVLVLDVYYISYDYWLEDLGTRSTYNHLELEFIQQRFKVSVCPAFWLSDEKLRKLNVSQDELRYVMGYLTDYGVVHDFGEKFNSVRTKIKTVLAQKFNDSLTQLFGSITKLYLDSDYDFFFMYDGPSFSTFCFQLPDAKFRIAPMGSYIMKDYLRFSLSMFDNYPHFKFPENLTYALHYSGQRMGAMTNGLRNIYLLRQKFTRLSVRLRHYIYYNGRKHKCIENERYDFLPTGYARDLCSLECLDAYYHQYNCSILPLFDHTKQTSLPQCNYYDEEMFEFHKRHVRSADKERLLQPDDACMERRKCNKLRFCNEWDIQISPVGKELTCEEYNKIHGVNGTECSEYYVHIWIDNRAEVVREYPLRNWNTVLSDYGGQLGLLVGVSVTSIMQLLIHWCSLCFRSNKESNRIANRKATMKRRQPLNGHAKPMEIENGLLDNNCNTGGLYVDDSASLSLKLQSESIV